MRYRRMPIEVESPEQLGYDTITNNLSESSVSDRRLADLGLDLASSASLDDLLLCYGDHLGDPMLRDAIAAGGSGLRADDVLVMPGAAAALFATATSLLEPGDHAVVVRTNYATNLETPRAIGADLDIVDLAFEDSWKLDVARVASLARSARRHQADLGHVPAQSDRHDARSRGAARARRAGRELGRDVARGRDVPRSHARHAVADGGHALDAISVSSMSKAYGLPGLRVGWAVCAIRRWPRRCWPRRSRCSSAARRSTRPSPARVLADRERILTPILADVLARLEIVRAWLRDQHIFEWVEPAGGVVGLVRFKPERECGHRALLRRRCSRNTARTSGRAIGSRSTIATSASGSAGRPSRSCTPASPR